MRLLGPRLRYGSKSNMLTVGRLLTGAFDLSRIVPSQARKKSTKIKFLGPETARWGGGLPREGVVAKNSVPALETLSSLGFEERNPGCPGNFAGMSQTPGGVQKVCAKKLRAHFSFPTIRTYACATLKF